MASEQQPAASWGADTDGRLNQPSEHLTDYAMWATDASGNVTGLVGPGGNVVPVTSAWRSEALTKLLPATPSFNKSSGMSALDWCSNFKMELEADFVGVRFLKINRGNQALNSDKMVAYSTETMAYDTNANGYFPVVDGTTYAALAAANSVYGFFPVTWGGASTVSQAASTSTAATLTLSDYVAMPSVPRKAGEASARPILGFRIEHLGATNGNWPFTPVSANVRTPVDAMRGRTFVLGQHGAVGAVDTLTTSKTFNLSTTAIEVYPIVRYKVPVFSVWGCGDSITSCTGITADMHAAWGFKACCDLSTPDKPVVWANLGVSSVASTDFWNNAKALLAAGVPAPSMLVMNVASINEYGSDPNARTAALTSNLASDVINTCRQYGINHIVMFGTLPNENIATSAADLIRVNQNTLLQTLAGNMNVYWLDTSGIGDGASPEKFIPAYKYDAFHPNETCQDAILVPRLTAIIRAAAGL